MIVMTIGILLCRNQLLRRVPGDLMGEVGDPGRLLWRSEYKYVMGRIQQFPWFVKMKPIRDRVTTNNLMMYHCDIKGDVTTKNDMHRFHRTPVLYLC